MSDVEQVKAALDFGALVREHTELHGSGKDLRGRCPIHGGDSPTAFVVYQDTKTFHCFRCGANGDAIEFVKETQGLDFRGALEFLAARTGVTLSGPAGRPRPPAERALEAAVAYWREQLSSPEGERARAYLASRGIAEHIWRPAGVGYCPEPGFRTFTHLLDAGHTEAAIVATKVYDERHFTQLAGRLIVPVRTNKRVTNLYGRAVGIVPSGERHRYTGAHHGLYGIDGVAEGEDVVVTEGIIDALALRSAGVKRTIATYGTSGLNEEAVAAIAAARPSEVLLFFDGDPAGRTAATRAGALFAAAGVPHRLVLTPEEEDPSSLVAAGADVVTLVEGAGTPADIAARQLVRRMAASSPEDRVQLGSLLERVAQAGLGSLTSSVVVNELAKALDLPSEAVRFEFNRIVADSPVTTRQGTGPCRTH